MRKAFISVSVILIVLLLLWAYYWHFALFFFIIVLPLVFMGFADMIQKKQSIKRNFPLLGRMRYFLEAIRPEIYQYFIESDTNGAPINRNDRSVIYQRAKEQIDTTPF